MKKPSLILLIVLQLLSRRAAGQTTYQGSLKGRLVDERQGAIPYATLLLKNAADSSLYRSTLSSANGAFEFKELKPGSFVLEASMLGFEKMKLGPLEIKNSDTKIDLGVLNLKSRQNMLGGVTIKASVPLIDHQLDKTVVNVAQSISSEGATVLEVLQKLPGVQVTPDGQISMSGKPGVTIYLDGKPTYLSAQDLSALLSSMPASNIQQMELMSNPSAKYDAAGTGGIINIVKKKNRKESLNGNMSASLIKGDYGKYNGALTLSYKNKNYNLFINNTYSYNKSLSSRTVTSDISDINNKPLSEQASANQGISNGHNYRPTLGLDIYLSPKTTLSLSGTAGFSASVNQLSSNMDVRDSLKNKISSIGFGSNLADHPVNYTLGLQLAHQLDTLGKTITFDADHSEYRNYPQQINFSQTNNAQGGFVSQTDALLLQHRQLDIYAAKVDFTLPLQNKARLEAGIKSSYVKAENDNTYYNQLGGQNLFDLSQSDYSINSENINAAYINVNKKAGNLSVQTGLRAEQTITRGKQTLSGESVQQNYLQLFPSLFIDYKLNDANSLNIKLGRRTDRAAYSEMVPFRRPQTATLYFQGNPNLKPQLCWHAELTWTWQSSLFITFNYDFYHDYIRTFPFLDSNRITITRIPINIQAAHSWDVDVLYSKKLLSWWSADNTLSVYQNAFTGQARGFSFNNGGLPTFYLSSNHSLQLGKKWSAECNFEYETKRQFASSTFGAYSVLSFGLKRQLFSNKATLTVNANNVLQTDDRYGIDRNVGLYQYSYFYSHSRSVGINFSYRFGSGKTSKVNLSSSSADEQGRAGN